MKSRLSASLLLVLMVAGGPAAGFAEPTEEASSAPEPVAVWETDYASALARAHREHKLVLLDFTGSDWCIWCHRLHDQILAKKSFVDYARDNLVLVELDFPRKTPQSAELKSQNETLSGKFSVGGYPTIIMVDADGRELGRTGYMEGGPKTFVRELRRFAAKATPDAKATP